MRRGGRSARGRLRLALVGGPFDGLRGPSLLAGRRAVYVRRTRRDGRPGIGVSARRKSPEQVRYDLVERREDDTFVYHHEDYVADLSSSADERLATRLAVG